jgi:MerR family transcriptional regulator, light-induced transcriptional regulator
VNHRPAAEPAWTAGEVARRLGIPLATLRSWNRRYDLGPSDHEPGRYRRFTEADIAVLDRMRRLIAGGMRPASAAALAGSGHPTGQLWAEAPALTTRLVDELLIVAHELDDAVLGHRLDRALVQHGVVRVWERLLVPALTRLGDEIGDTTRCIDVEHLLSWSIQASLHRVAPPSRADGTPVLLACAPGERHTLPLEALCAALAERGVRARMLGAEVPIASLVEAANRGRPAAIVLWAHTPATASPGALMAVRGCTDRAIVGGTGWPVGRLPDGVRYARSLRHALRLIEALEEEAQ